MNKQILLIFLLCSTGLICSSCDGLYLSIFPSFVGDTEIMKNLADTIDSFDSSDIKGYSIGVLTATPAGPEMVFLVMQLYNGRKRLVIYDPDLNAIWDSRTAFAPDDTILYHFGDRIFYSKATGNYFVGNTYFSSIPPVTVNLLNTPPGSNGYGTQMNINANNNCIMVFNKDESSKYFNFQYYTSLAVGGTSLGTPPVIGDNTLDYRLDFACSMYDVDIPDSPFPSNPMDFAAFVFHVDDYQGVQTDGYVTIIRYGSTFPPPGPVIYEPAASGYYTYFLGAVYEDTRVVREGIIFRRKDDGMLRLMDWRYNMVAKTNYTGRFNNVEYGYGYFGSTYVFDPSSLKLYKVKNWWL